MVIGGIGTGQAGAGPAAGQARDKGKAGQNARQDKAL